MKVARQHGVERLERELTAKPGAVELLNCIKKAGLPCAVATATSRSRPEERLTRLQLIQYFDYICCGDEVVERKPSPEAYLKVLAKMNTAPEDALVFEDSKVGVQAAWNARIPVIMVPDLMPPTEVQKRQAIKIIDSLSAAVPIIEELSKDDFSEAIRATIEERYKDRNLVVLLDLPGGSPANTALPFMSSSRKLIAGVNLPLVLEIMAMKKSGTTWEELDLDDTCKSAAQSIVLYNNFLNGGNV